MAETKFFCLVHDIITILQILQLFLYNFIWRFACVPLMQYVVTINKADTLQNDF